MAKTTYPKGIEITAALPATARGDVSVVPLRLISWSCGDEYFRVMRERNKAERAQLD